MALIEAIYEGGVFRPLEHVDLPEGTTLKLHVPSEVFDVRALVPPGTDESLIRVYEALNQSYDTGDPFAAERHNERQP